MTDHQHPLDKILSRVDFLLAGIEEGSIEVSNDLYSRILGPRYGRSPE